MSPGLLLMIGVGGAAGSYARYRISGWVYGRFGTGFPWGTLSVNLTGSFLLGLILPLVDAPGVEPAVRAFVTVGFIGAFTTFSTFAAEAVVLLLGGERLRTLAYLSSSVGLGLVAILAGFALGGLLY